MVTTMEIDHDLSKGSLTISMKRDIEAMLTKYGMLECKPESTQVVAGSKLAKSTEIDPEAASFPYREAVGELLWFARTGRQDILYSASYHPIFSKFCNSWGQSHVTAVKRTKRFLKGTLELKFTLRYAEDPRLIVYADADFAGEPE